MMKAMEDAMRYDAVGNDEQIRALIVARRVLMGGDFGGGRLSGDESSGYDRMVCGLKDFEQDLGDDLEEILLDGVANWRRLLSSLDDVMFGNVG
ncbi:hypothetical protein O3M35_000617 [Rhynocoris fuscipes]|uniref:Uncharacterized protein n=1 Tax=Rhynocoris fuscipes TaxID=488301 RepID=A0AAW1DM96_9HEMI